MVGGGGVTVREGLHESHPPIRGQRETRFKKKPAAEPKRSRETRDHLDRLSLNITAGFYGGSDGTNLTKTPVWAF